MKTLFSILGFWLLIAGIYADEAHEWIDRINEKYGNMHTFAADFTQKNIWSELDVEKVSRGTMYFADERFCMRYSFPEGQFLLVDADSMLVYDAASSQAMITYPDTGETGLRPDMILSHYAGDNATMTCEKRSESQLTIRIIPLDVRDIKRIDATIDTVRLVILSVSYTDVENNTVEYRFEEVRLDCPIGTDVFRFEIPENAILIDQRL